MDVRNLEEQPVLLTDEPSFHPYLYFLVVCVCVHKCRFREVWKRVLDSWNWNYMWWWVTLQVLGTELGSSTRTVCVLNF